MIICETPCGRLGNAIFRYMATTLFLMNYNITRVKFIDGLHNKTPKSVIIRDSDFVDFINYIENNKSLPEFDNGTICVMQGFFQFDLYRKYMKRILKYMKKHKDDELYCTGYKNDEKFYVRDILKPPPKVAEYDIVVHVRLEDFIFNKHVIHPKVLKNILKQILKENKDKQYKICIISNKPKQQIEYEYLGYFVQKFGVDFVTNDIITDFHTMMNAKILVCSRSTISWCAAFLSKNINTVYIPDKIINSHQPFSVPHDNTILYPNRVCGESELHEYFSHKNKI